MVKQTNNQAQDLSEREINLLRMLREMGNGELTLLICDGAPVVAEEIRKNIEL
ncbi:hypothetical protein SAMN02745823_02816 [Sporobacter termitidis DSM 10068]|uniref:Uncharacterized protein n=1 Tax=Sporobacter termitidis DSM 10068 TaxID=1123282 RepID=A0A1M5YSY1_9FIRM|nr:hypothetical protein [Sporobacter termitidis]SHI15069.1 hypothetical protein SAMN02745823_02816 [Sporobacter termitidis DSM 10068]